MTSLPDTDPIVMMARAWLHGEPLSTIAASKLTPLVESWGVTAATCDDPPDGTLCNVAVRDPYPCGCRDIVYVYRTPENPQCAEALTDPVTVEAPALQYAIAAATIVLLRHPVFEGHIGPEYEPLQ